MLPEIFGGNLAMIYAMKEWFGNLAMIVKKDGLVICHQERLQEIFNAMIYVWDGYF